MSRNVQQKQPTRAARSRRTVIVVAIVAVIAMAAIAALTTGSGNDPSTADVVISETQSVTVSGVALPRYPEQGADPAIGMPAPELTGASFDGTPVIIANDGVPKILMFVAHWCPHCNNDVEALTPYIATNGLPDGVGFYAISTGSDSGAPNYPPSKWLRDFPVTTLADNPQSAAAQAFGLNAFPFFVFVTSEGNVDFRFPGEVPPETLYEAARTLAGS